MKVHYPPILLFAYNRLEHLRLTVDSLKRNKGASDHTLLIYCDGPKSSADNRAVEAVRKEARAVEGFKSVTCIESKVNRGLANSIISGVSDTLEKCDSVIVLEDDMVTSPFFLKYMREALSLYRDDPRVFSVHGYNYPANFDAVEGESFFKRGADCWGWATWANAWKTFEKDARKLLSDLRSQKLIEEFDYGGAYPFSTMLKRQARGKIDSWAIRWNASVFLQNGLTLNPKKSLVKNVGLDGSGVHCIESDNFDTEVSDKPISVYCGPVENNREAFIAIAAYLEEQSGQRFSWRALSHHVLAFFRSAS
jgi:hypothetical protein